MRELHGAEGWRRRGAVLLGVLAVVAGSLGGAGEAATRLSVDRTVIRAVGSNCVRPRSTGFAYHYPVKPFDVQHPIRGFFGDPRTVTTATFGEDRPGSVGSFTFHNGVDIYAATGTLVYPVVSGVVKIARGDRVVVVSPDFRTFQYYHVRPAVHAGQRVVAYRTLLGRVLPRWLHVHLTEIDGFRVHNPADLGHLEPYVDRTVPTVEDLLFTNEHGAAITPTALKGRVLVAADAYDIPPLPVPGLWFDFPVTPALVTWRLSSNGTIVIPQTAAADFRLTEPPDSDFWRVYAAGTYQNFPVFDHIYYIHRRGRYLFNLTPSPLDTTALRNGAYALTVDVADVCGNRESFTQRVVVRN